MMPNALRSAARPSRKSLLLAFYFVATFAAARSAAADPDAPPTASAQASGWSRDDAAHLLRRAAFGGTPQQIDALHALGRYAAVEHLLTGELPEGARPVFAKVDLQAFEPLPATEPDRGEREKMFEMARQARAAGPDSEAAKKVEAQRKALQRQQQFQERAELDRLRPWWVDRMLRTDRPLEEKMTLFWHNLFTSGVREVRSSRMMADQVALLHAHALGNYRKLTRAVVHDGAMLRYLNNDQNVRGKPNENLARELLELFTLGEGNGYTEQDIKEVARALTGLAPGGRGGPNGGRGYGGPVTMRAFLHDGGPKTIFGKTGDFGPDDVVGLIFAKPEPSRYLARRLWTAFASPDPSDEDLAPVVRAIRDGDYELVPALRAVFNHPSFYSDRARFAVIKSPAEVAVGTMRLLDRGMPSAPQVAFVGRQMAAMDQELLQPPNVRGWVGGDNWITAATLFTRYNTASMMVAGGGGDVQRPGRPFGGGQPTPEQIRAFMEQRAARQGGAATRPAGGPAKPGAQGTPEEIRAFIQQRAARLSGPATTRPAADGASPAARPRMAENPQMREQMIQQFAGRRNAGGATTAPMAPVEPATLFPGLDATPTAAQVVDAAIARFLQRPLPADKRQALIEAVGEEPLKLGNRDSDDRIRQVLSLVLSTPEYQLQ
jgi:uncharacterized protein (DUF1800 family)